MSASTRRTALEFVLKILVLVGLVALSIPFIVSLDTDQTGESTALTPWHVEVDWSTIQPGSYRVINWPRQQEVWIYRRHQYDLGQLRNADESRLRDPLSRSSQQPPALPHPWRSLHPDIFVFLPYETTRGCRLRFDAEQHQFIDLCHGARFDTAGRVLRGRGLDSQRNLVVPNYELTGDNSLRLLPP